jgi:hypothetical protein
MEFENLNNFCKIIRDLLNDLETTFPEYKEQYTSISNSLTHGESQFKLHEYCLKVIPPRFFDILYQNDDIFDDPEIDTQFLPGIDFKNLIKNKDISENTQKILWKYLQLMLFTLVEDVKDKDMFGDTASLFSGINEDDLQEKMKEAFDNMGNLFENIESKMKHEDKDDQPKSSDDKSEEKSDEKSDENTSGFQMPNLGSIQDHLKTILEGKIGNLAKELASELGDEFKDMLGDGDNVNPKDLFKNLIKNPKQIKDLIHKITTKIEDKMKSGNISRDELMKEASDIMGKMKEFGGKDEMMNMMKGMAKSMGGKKGRFNMGAFESMAREHEQKERLRKKIEERRKAKIVEENNKKTFVIEGETQEKTDYIHPEILKELEEADLEKSKSKATSSSTNKKKKKKKKKN